MVTLSNYMRSVKSNIGHLEGGSGLVQVVKAVMMLEQGQIPPSLYYEKPNPRIPMEEWNLRVPTELTPWPMPGLRRISINSFGYGGTNAHCILDDAYHYLKERRLVGKHNVQVQDALSPAPSEDSAVALPDTGSDTELSSNDAGYPVDSHRRSGRKRLIVWSSHDEGGIARTATAYASYLAQVVSTDKEGKQHEILQRLAYTMGSRRSQLPWK